MQINTGHHFCAACSSENVQQTNLSNKRLLKTMRLNSKILKRFLVSYYPLNFKKKHLNMHTIKSYHKGLVFKVYVKAELS